jgi:hypothetical protein
MATQDRADRGDGGWGRARRGRAVAVLSLALLAASGCRASTRDVVAHGAPLSRPQLIIVHDFTSTAGEARLDSSVVSRIGQRGQVAQGTPLSEQQAQLQQKVTQLMTERLVEEIRKLGLPVEAAAQVGPVEGPALSIEGQFIALDEGNRAKRLLIGFGWGASEVRVAVQVFETGPGLRRPLEDFSMTARSSRKPGFGPLFGIGAAVGAAAEAIGASFGAGTLLGSQDVEGSAKRGAVEITKQLARLLAQHGWITTEQADRYRLTP